MRTLLVNRICFMFILVAVLISFTQGSYGQTITATSVPQPLTEVNLHGSVVTLTLTGGTYERFEWDIGDAVAVSGIDGVAFDSWDLDRESDTEVTVELMFDGDFDADATLTFTVGAGAISGYNGNALSAAVPVTAVTESLVVSTESSLTEETLHGSVVTLTLSGRRFNGGWDIERALTISGIDGVTVGTFGVDRVSDTEVTIELAFDGDFDTDATLTFTVGAGAISGYNGNALSAAVPVTAVTESLVVSTKSSLTEETLHGSVVTLTLNGRRFNDEWDIERALTISGIDGVTVNTFGVDRVSDTEVTVALAFNGDFDTDATLTFNVGGGAIAGYNQGFTATLPVTSVSESLLASTEFPLSEATLYGSVVTLTLSGRRFNGERDIERALTISGIDGVTVDTFGVDRVSNTEVTIELAFDGDFDTDATLTFTLGASAIAGYNQGLTAQLPVTAAEQSNATVSVSPSRVVSPAIGEQLKLSLNITNGENVAGYQAIVLFDSTALRYVESTNGDYLSADAFFLKPSIDYVLAELRFGRVILAASTLGDARNGDGTLVNLTFEVVEVKASTLIDFGIFLIDPDGKRWEATIESGQVIEPSDKILGDIDRDGIVDIQDLVLVSTRFGQRGHNSADVNGDGLVDIVDLVLVAGAFTEEAAAPSLYSQSLELLTAAEVRQWLIQAQYLALTNPTYLRGITALEQLHAALIPQKTALLPNYPNPFNPETWIPYHLSNDAVVQISIYDSKGVLVRWLDLGHQIAGYYTDRTKAAYWDGRNEFGERVASGVYFYHLSTGDFYTTRKMLILK